MENLKTRFNNKLEREFQKEIKRLAEVVIRCRFSSFGNDEDLKTCFAVMRYIESHKKELGILNITEERIGFFKRNFCSCRDYSNAHEVWYVEDTSHEIFRIVWEYYIPLDV